MKTFALCLSALLASAAHAAPPPAGAACYRVTMDPKSDPKAPLIARAEMVSAPNAKACSGKNVSLVAVCEKGAAKYQGIYANAPKSGQPRDRFIAQEAAEACKAAVGTAKDVTQKIVSPTFK